MAALSPSPGKPFQSKLIPFEDFIRFLRRKRVSYRQIARVLEQEKGCKVYHKTIISFIRVRSRPIPEDRFTPYAIGSQLTDGAIERLKNKLPAESEKPIFSFNPDQSLTLTRKPIS